MASDWPTCAAVRSGTGACGEVYWPDYHL